MCDSVHTALCSPMFAKSLPVQLLSLQIKRQLHEAVSSVQRELRECCLEPLPNLGLGSWSVWEAADLTWALPCCHEDTHTWRHPTLAVLSAQSLPSLCWGAAGGNSRRYAQKSQYGTSTSHPCEDTRTQHGHSPSWRVTATVRWAWQCQVNGWI